LKQNNSKRDALDDIRKKRSLKSKRDSSESESGEIEDEQNSFSDNSSISSSLEMSDDEKDMRKSYVLTLYEVEKIKITRSFIEKYHDTPLFDDMVKGAFVKINISDGKSNQPGYLLGQIKEVAENQERPYSFMNKKICKYLKVAHANMEKLFMFNVISNSPITDFEFKVWFERNEKVYLINLA
jgi:hypothetical protein